MPGKDCQIAYCACPLRSHRAVPTPLVTDRAGEQSSGKAGKQTFSSYYQAEKLDCAGKGTVIQQKNFVVVKPAKFKTL